MTGARPDRAAATHARAGAPAPRAQTGAAAARAQTGAAAARAQSGAAAARAQRGAAAARAQTGAAGARAVHPIERESYAILRSRLDTSGLPPWTRAVVERVIHASADLDYAGDLVCVEEWLAAGARALRAGAPVVADSAMTAAGITARQVICRVAGPPAARLAGERRITRSAAGIRLAHAEVGPGAVWVIGTAPTALAELIALRAAPALVIGLPVGFVGAAEAKQALRDAALPSVTNRSEKGGAAVAAAALNALLYQQETFT